jgi:hypothetical protein
MPGREGEEGEEEEGGEPTSSSFRHIVGQKSVEKSE